MSLMKYKPGMCALIVILVALASSCSAVPQSDMAGPAISKIETSSKVLAKSDCIPTSLTITSNVIDPEGIASVSLWYRVGKDQNFTPTNMAHANDDQYIATIKALDIPGGEYGIFEFYITAQDKTGNQSKSSTDTSVELSRCVG